MMFERNSVTEFIGLGDNVKDAVPDGLGVWVFGTVWGGV